MRKPKAEGRKQKAEMIPNVARASIGGAFLLSAFCFLLS
jgi:hypothetical protein